MYSPINEDFMFQQMRDRRERLSVVRGGSPATRPGKRWWRKSPQRAR